MLPRWPISICRPSVFGSGTALPPGPISHVMLSIVTSKSPKLQPINMRFVEVIWRVFLPRGWKRKPAMGMRTSCHPVSACESDLPSNGTLWSHPSSSGSKSQMCMAAFVVAECL